MPDVDVTLVPPVVALGEGLAIREYITFSFVNALPKAIVVQPGCPVVDVTRANLSISCTKEKSVVTKEQSRYGDS